MPFVGVSIGVTPNISSELNHNGSKIVEPNGEGVVFNPVRNLVLSSVEVTISQIVFLILLRLNRRMSHARI